MIPPASRTATPPETASGSRAARADRQPDSQRESSADRDLNRQLLRSMLLQRRFEERCGEAYATGKIGGFCHLYIGQEAVSTGTISLLRDDDYVITTYRDHGQALARGLSARSVMAELFGRRDGCAGGKGGSMHMFSREHNFLGGHGIVGAHVPIATGVGFAIKYRGGDQVIVCFMGEAAVNNGAFHEALNMAALWSLPCVFVIENNKYGMGTDFQRAAAVTSLNERASAYGMANGVVDGQDVHEVRARVSDAISAARGGKPILLEVRTSRFMGHSMSDAASGTYRSKAELEENMKRDPITLLRARMQEAGELDDAAFNAMDEEVKSEVQDALDFADASPEPDPAALYTDVFAEEA